MSSFASSFRCCWRRTAACGIDSRHCADGAAYLHSFVSISLGLLPFLGTTFPRHACTVLVAGAGGGAQAAVGCGTHRKRCCSASSPPIPTFQGLFSAPTHRLPICARCRSRAPGASSRSVALKAGTAGPVGMMHNGYANGAVAPAHVPARTGGKQGEACFSSTSGRIWMI